MRRKPIEVRSTRICDHDEDVTCTACADSTRGAHPVAIRITIKIGPFEITYDPSQHS
jgi:hypothetical protein